MPAAVVLRMRFHLFGLFDLVPVLLYTAGFVFVYVYMDAGGFCLAVNGKHGHAGHYGEFH